LRLASLLAWGSIPLVAFLACGGPETESRDPDSFPVDHIIVIYQENHGFDSLYGSFPGAEGLQNADARVEQVDKAGEEYVRLPQPLNVGDPRDHARPPGPDERFPDDLPNAPFDITKYAPLDQRTAAPLHRFYQHQLQMNDGKMNRFVAYSNAGGLTMGYNDTQKLPLYPYARDYVLADNFFTGAFGGSMLNHFWLFCACTPKWPDAPPGMVADPVYDSDGNLTGLKNDGEVTPDGYAINDSLPYYEPHTPGVPDSNRVPPQTMSTIGDRLSERGVSWAWYAEGWNEAVSGKAFPGEHPAIVYFEKYGAGTKNRKEHIKDEEVFREQLQDGGLPAVSFLNQLGDYSEHAGSSSILQSEEHVVDLIEDVKRSRYWESTAIIVTYDDYGGWFDHVPPPKGDRWGPGGRAPALIISPHAKKGFVDHTAYDTTSILRFIEWRHDLEPLGERKSNNMLAAFQFENS
jgi:phospholipase C